MGIFMHALRALSLLEFYWL